MQKLKNNEPWPEFTGSYKKKACIKKYHDGKIYFKLYIFKLIHALKLPAILLLSVDVRMDGQTTRAGIRFFIRKRTWNIFFKSSLRL